MESYIMAIDQGTTSSRAIIVNKKGEIIAKAQEEFEQIYPESGWVEHDANQIWNNVQAVIAQAFIQSELQPENIAAIGITNQRETAVVWEKDTGRPIYHAVVWQSRQTAEIVKELKQAGHEALFQAKTGLILDAYYSATKVRWILDQVEGAQARAERGELLFGTIDSWLVYKLTDKEVHVTDYTNAARTMLFDIYNLKWDEEILQLLNIPASMLAEVKSSSEIYGYTKSYLFFGQAVPIAGIAGDQQAALFGQMAFKEGMVKNTYGTGSFMIMNTGKTAKASQHNLVTTIAYGLNGEVNYALEGSIFVTGAAVQWLRDGLELFSDAKQTEEMAQAASAVDDIYIVPAFTGLGAPYWTPDARGAIYGLTRASTKNDLAKAVLQAIAYQSRDVLDTMEQDTGLIIKEIRVDGGAALNSYLMQFQADIADVTVIRAKQLETTALGAAYLAGLAVNYWQDLAELQSLVAIGESFQPQMPEEIREQLYEGWQHAVQATIFYAQIKKTKSLEGE